ncbi:hypothetical protein ACLOJK_022601, partial [Asimina triloba]
DKAPLLDRQTWPARVQIMLRHRSTITRLHLPRNTDLQRLAGDCSTGDLPRPTVRRHHSDRRSPSGINPSPESRPHTARHDLAEITSSPTAP